MSFHLVSLFWNQYLSFFPILFPFSFKKDACEIHKRFPIFYGHTVLDLKCRGKGRHCNVVKRCPDLAGHSHIQIIFTSHRSHCLHSPPQKICMRYSQDYNIGDAQPWLAMTLRRSYLSHRLMSNASTTCWIPGSFSAQNILSDNMGWGECWGECQTHWKKANVSHRYVLFKIIMALLFILLMTACPTPITWLLITFSE